MKEENHHTREVDGLITKNVHFAGSEQRLELVDGEIEVLPGIRVIWTSGHSPADQMVTVEATQGTVIIPGGENSKPTFPWLLLQLRQRSRGYGSGT